MDDDSDFLSDLQLDDVLGVMEQPLQPVTVTDPFAASNAPPLTQRGASKKALQFGDDDYFESIETM